MTPRIPRNATSGRILRFAPLILLLAVDLSALQDRTAEIQVYVFSPDGRPRAGALVKTGEVQALTDTSGAARLRVPSGRCAITVSSGADPSARSTVDAVAGSVTEIIVRLGEPGKPARVDVEGAGAAGVAAPRPDGKKVRAPGTIAGRIIDEKEGRPVVGARVFARGSAESARTDADGRFTLRIPGGTVALAVVHPEYATETVAGVDVPENGSASVEVKLTPSSVELPSETVRGYRMEGGLVELQAERREEKAVVEIIGREQFSKSGDSDAAAALQRVTGLTVVDGKFVYVRGMGQRYSSTLLNGALLPSPEPERRVVPLDLFPVDVLESVEIRKTYTPDLPGEFGGGAVLLRTRSMPEKFVLGASLSMGFSTATTFKKGLTYDGGGTDFLGFDDGTRALPGIVESAADIEPLFLEDPITGEGWPAADLERFGEAMQNVWQADEFTVPMDLGFDFTIGNRISLFGRPFGYQCSVMYENQYETRRKAIRSFSIGAGGALQPNYDYASLSTEHTINLGTIVNLTWQLAEKQELSMTTLLLRTTRDKVEVYEGDFTDGNAWIRVTELEWVEQMLLSTQLRGRHSIGGAVDLDWHAVYALATREEPDARKTRYDRDPASGRFGLSNRPEGNQRMFNTLNDDSIDLALNGKIPFSMGQDLEASFRTGAALVLRNRDSETRRFKFMHRGPDASDPNVLFLPPEQIFIPQYIGPNGFSFEEITRATDSYDATQTITAFYVLGDLPLSKQWELSAGARLESSSQEVTTFNLTDPTQKQVADLATTDLLPALNVAWKFIPEMQVRAGYSKTLSRPDFRELSEAPFDQVIGGGVFIGNPNLRRCSIDNYDVRWEWYPSPEESVSAGFFYKDLSNPIETVLIGGANRTTTLENAKSATNFGVEVEFRKKLSFLGEGYRNFYVSGNLAIIQSNVKISNPGIATETRRPLQGQSPYVVNFAAGYDDPEHQVSLAFLYNVSGERIAEIGANGLPDIYEQPLHQLDFVASWGISENSAFKFKIKNLLNEDVDFTQRDQTARHYKKGIDLSIEYTWHY